MGAGEGAAEQRHEAGRQVLLETLVGTHQLDGREKQQEDVQSLQGKEVAA